MTYLIFGCFLIAVGILGRIYPNIIAGYNAMDEDKKKRFNINAYSKWFLGVFSAMGLSLIGIKNASGYLGVDEWLHLISLGLMLIGVLVLLMLGTWYKRDL